MDIGTLRELQRVQDLADIQICERSKADSTGGLTHDEVMALLAADDAARA